MTWRDELRRITLPDGRLAAGGSFRGVPFLVPRRERTGGRRVVVHEFPGRDEPVVDDLGRQARRFPLEAYVLGDNYLQQKRALQDALEAAGPGRLVDPYERGDITAVCVGWSVQERAEEGRMARFSLEFVEAPPLAIAPVSTGDLDSLAEAAALISLAASVTAADDDLVTTGQPAFAIDSLEADVIGIADQLLTSLSPVAASVQELAALNSEVQTLRTTARTLLTEPQSLQDAISATIRAVADGLASEPQAALRALLDAFDVARQPDAIGDTTIRQQERENQVALGDLMRHQLVVEAGRLLVQVSYEATSEALADRELVLERIDDLLGTQRDVAFESLVVFRAALTDAVPGDEELASVTDTTPLVETPSLLLSYQLYGSVDGEASILARNSTEHPGFLLGKLEVLSSV